jgi:hypothetical protein
MKRKPVSLQRKYLAFLPLIKLIAKKNFHFSSKPHEILGTSKKKFDLLLAGKYGKLSLDEMAKWTAKIIMHYNKVKKHDRRK